jgi:hypothetical protein
MTPANRWRQRDDDVNSDDNGIQRSWQRATTDGSVISEIQDSEDRVQLLAVGKHGKRAPEL